MYILSTCLNRHICLQAKQTTLIVFQVADSAKLQLYHQLNEPQFLLIEVLVSYFLYILIACWKAHGIMPFLNKSQYEISFLTRNSMRRYNTHISEEINNPNNYSHQKYDNVSGMKLKRGLLYTQKKVQNNHCICLSF